MTETVLQARDRFDREQDVRTDGKVHREPVNLDAMCVGDLRVAIGHPALHADVRAYADVKLGAFEARKAGQGARAMRLERNAQHIYLGIPEALRW